MHPIARLKSLLGGRRDRPDPRDLFHLPKLDPQTLPPAVDLRPGCPPVYDQGKIAACTANAIAGAIAYSRRKHGQSPDFTPSRLFIYYNERAVRGEEALDSGASTRDGTTAWRPG